MQKNKNKNLNPLEIIVAIYPHVSKYRKQQLLVIISLTLIASLLEVFALGSVIPFLVVIDNPQKVFEITIIKNVYIFFGITSTSKILLITTILFCSAAFISASTRAFSLYANNKISAAIGNDISKEVFKKTIFQPYEYHLSKNSSEFLSVISTKITYLVSVIQLFLQMILNFFISLFVIGFLMFYSFKITILLIIIFPSLYSLVSVLVRKKLNETGYQLSKSNNILIKITQETISSIKELIMLGRPEIYYKNFGAADRIIRQKNVENQVISQTPKFLFEAFGIIFLASIAYFLVSNSAINNEKSFIPILGTFALAAQKILPLLQAIYTSYAKITFYSPSVIEVLNNLSLKISKRESNIPKNRIVFDKKLKLSNISFGYFNSNKLIIEDLNMEIKAGDCIGIKGKSGSGKSTLINLIMGLLPPTSGDFFIDGKNIYDKNYPERLMSWRLAIAYVPQDFNLIDNTLAVNISLDSKPEEISFERLRYAAEKAQILEFINSLPLGFNTYIGERGVKLSGGQKQRIAIARAFYKDSKILILDEASSALDSKTESSLIETIKKIKSKLTILIVAHRKSNLSICDKVYTLSLNKNLEESF